MVTISRKQHNNLMCISCRLSWNYLERDRGGCNIMVSKISNSCVIKCIYVNICRYVYILMEHVLINFKGPIAYQWNFMCCMRDVWSPTLRENICLHSLVMSGSYVWHSYSVEDINKLFASTYTTKRHWHVYVHKKRHWYMGHRWPN
jgi:hypothetical protein